MEEKDANRTIHANGHIVLEEKEADNPRMLTCVPPPNVTRENDSVCFQGRKVHENLSLDAPSLCLLRGT